MNKIFISVVLGLFAFEAQAYINEPITKLTEPKKIYLPYKIIVPSNRIYTPNQYSCYVRQKRKFCQNKHGRGD